MKSLTPLLLILLLFHTEAFAHGDEDHSKSTNETGDKQEQPSDSKTKGAEFEKEKLESIAKAYKEHIEPIFETKCYDCHSSNKTDYPWYHSIPGIKRLMNADIREGQKHIILSDGFPFKGHGSVLGDLKSLKKSVEEDSMPIMEYKLMHWNSGLTPVEKKQILDWIENSSKTLESK